MKNALETQSALSVNTAWFDCWAQPLCTAVLILGASFIVGHLIYAAWMGRLVVR